MNPDHPIGAGQDQGRQVGASRCTSGRFRQGVTVEKDATCGAVADALSIHCAAGACSGALRLWADAVIGIRDL
jgi:hypothetical protein